MQNIDLICVGKLNAKYFAEGVAEYQKRLAAFANFRIIELPEEKIEEKNASDAVVKKALEKEGKAILSSVRKGASIVALCIEGKQISSEELAQFLNYLYAQIAPEEVVVVLTSDHGTSPSYDAGIVERDRFNAAQFQVIVNSFLCAQHGPGEWVVDYEDNNLYLNHTLIYNKGLDLAAIQNEAATFAMQFRGVSHALSSTAMRSSYFGSGYGEKMQNSFYPRRSGDVVVNLMPGCIEERPDVRSKSGSMYGYDTTVPLVLYGGGIPARRVGRSVDMTSVAPTLAYLLDIPEPAASEGTVLEEFRK